MQGKSPAAVSYIPEQFFSLPVRMDGLKCQSPWYSWRQLGQTAWSQAQGGEVGDSRAPFRAHLSRVGHWIPYPDTHRARACLLRSVCRRFHSSTLGRIHPSVCLCSPHVVWGREDNFFFLHKVHRTNTSDWCRAARQNPTNTILGCQNPSLTSL